MAVIEQIIKLGEKDTISFGNYLVKEKQKVDKFELNGDVYKIKTHKDVTRLEKNGNLLLESVPGSTIHNFSLTENIAVFLAEGFGDTKITLELLPECEYKIVIDNETVGSMKSNLSGKINFSTELSSDSKKVKVQLIKNN